VKLPFLLAGNLLIHLLNIVRNFLLTLMSMHRSAYFELFHRYVFVFMVCGAIFLLWMLWANKYRYYGFKSETETK
jgi:exosortase/archaeosortase family protein